MKEQVRTCEAYHSNTMTTQLKYPVHIGHRGKTARRRKPKTCTDCGSEAGLLIIALPGNMWRNKKLCPDCIKPFRKKYGWRMDVTRKTYPKTGALIIDEVQVPIPVNMWGQSRRIK